MRRLFIIVSLVYCHINLLAQYKGGSNDGWTSSVSINQNPLTNVYTGGNNDGYSSLSASNQNPLTNIYAGGSNDGFDSAFAVGQNPLANIYTGGVDDGFDMLEAAAQNPLPGIYFGGNNDGYHLATIINQNPLPGIYLGGNNDGFTRLAIYNQNPGCIGDNAIWNGSISIAWEEPANWDCGVLPNINSNVIIHSGVARYPTVSFWFEIISLTLLQGASINILPGVNFILNGQ